MKTVTSRDALGYALSRDMAMLYGVVIVGYIAMLVAGWVATGWALRGGGAGVIGHLLAAALVLGGFLAVLAGIIGFIYKVIADANVVAANSARETPPGRH